VLSKTLLVFGLVGVLTVGILSSGFGNTALAKVVCREGSDGKKHCFDFQPLEPDNNKLGHLDVPDPPLSGP
jgi:hypothetical protein